MLFLLMLLVRKVVTLSCPAGNMFPVLHEWYQPGDLILGGMVSQIIHNVFGIEFKKHPSLKRYDLPLNSIKHTLITPLLLYPQFNRLDQDLPELSNSISIITDKLKDRKAYVFVVHGESITIVRHKYFHHDKCLKMLFLLMLLVWKVVTLSCPVSNAFPVPHEWYQPGNLIVGISFNNSAGERVFLNEKGEATGGFDITNLITFPNRSFQRIRVGKMDPHILNAKELIIDEEVIIWHPAFNQVLPISQCNDHCSPGYWKKGSEGKQFCCYNCVPCPEGKISNQKGRYYRTHKYFHHPKSLKMFFLLMFLMQRVTILSCPASEAFPVRHEWYQPGELFIGGMVSHIFYHFYEIAFKEQPSYDLPLFLLFLCVMTTVPLDPGREGLKAVSSVAMIVFRAQKERFLIKL
ncbi:hypothetical protein E2320_003562, partial [Naja naja]